VAFGELPADEGLVCSFQTCGLPNGFAILEAVVCQTGLPFWKQWFAVLKLMVCSYLDVVCQ
jgi:hypothetical protein